MKIKSQLSSIIFLTILSCNQPQLNEAGLKDLTDLRKKYPCSDISLGVTQTQEKDSSNNIVERDYLNIAFIGCKRCINFDCIDSSLEVLRLKSLNLFLNCKNHSQYYGAICDVSDFESLSFEKRYYFKYDNLAKTFVLEDSELLQTLFGNRKSGKIDCDCN